MAAKKEKSKKKIASFIVLAVVVVIVVLSLILAARQTNSFSDKFKSFYVEYNGKVLTSEANLNLTSDTVRFDVRDKIFIKSDIDDYTVRVITTAQNSFGFEVDGYYVKYQSDWDVTEAFDVKKAKGRFTISLPEMQQVLKTLFANSQIATGTYSNSYSYFKIIVSNGKAERRISIIYNTSGAVDSDIDIKIYPDYVKF